MGPAIVIKKTRANARPNSANLRSTRSVDFKIDASRVWTLVKKQFSGRHKLIFGPRAVRARDLRARYFPRETAI